MLNALTQVKSDFVRHKNFQTLTTDKWHFTGPDIINDIFKRGNETF